MRSAGGTSFAGDFIVAARARRATGSSSSVVDVSGKGVEAGSRSLFLSGRLQRHALRAAAGTSSCLRPTTTCCGQDWDEGFATAIHLHLDLQHR